MSNRYIHYWNGGHTPFRRMIIISLVLHCALAGALVVGWPFKPEKDEKIYSVMLIAAPKGDKDVVPTAPEPAKQASAAKPAEKPAPPKPEPEPEKPKPEPEKPKPEPEKPKPKPKKEEPKPKPKKEEPKKEEKKKPEPKKEEKKPEPKKEVAKKEEPKKTEPKPKPKPVDLEALTPLDDMEPVKPSNAAAELEPLVVAMNDPILREGSAIEPAQSTIISLGDGISSSWGNKLQRMIDRAWKQPSNVMVDPNNAVATVAFTVAADGRLLDEPVVTKHASDPAVGESAVRAVKLAAPFPPLEAHGKLEQRVVCDFRLTR